ncbi:unknown protein [Seminavis robusta]|nr:unknown protein [Seminavis robusta]|eukprot:Sro584_g170781.1  (132) ;mRNA; f:21052-21447
MHDKIQGYMKQLRIDRANGMAYQTGSAMESEETNGRGPLSEVVCSKCNRRGHKDARSGLCPNNGRNRRKRSRVDPPNETSVGEEEHNNVVPRNEDEDNEDGATNEISLIDNIPLTSDPRIAELSESLANDS